MAIIKESITNADEDVQKKEYYIVGGNVNWYSHYVNWYIRHGGSL